MSQPYRRKETIGPCDRTVAIYALCEGPKDRPRYVGKTVQYLHKRHKQHIYQAVRGSKLPVGRWIRKQIERDEILTIRLLEFVWPGDDWVSRERYWIDWVREAYSDCLNICDGGEGLSGHSFSESHKRKIAAALTKGRYHACDQCGDQFYRKPKDARSPHLFCSRRCYQTWQRGRPKDNSSGLMGVAGRAAALAARRSRHG